jgi:protein arginine kinase
MGVIRDLKPDDLNVLFILSGPACIQEMAGRSLSPLERDLSRADFIRKKILK